MRAEARAAEEWQAKLLSANSFRPGADPRAAAALLLVRGQNHSAWLKQCARAVDWRGLGAFAGMVPREHVQAQVQASGAKRWSRRAYRVRRSWHAEVEVETRSR